MARPGNIEIEKLKFHYSKYPIHIDNADFDKIMIPKNVCFGKGFEYFMRYSYGCSFVAKLSRKKNLKKKTSVFFTKYILFAEKTKITKRNKNFMQKRTITVKNVFSDKNFLYRKLFVKTLWQTL